ncbi:hypothetical protein [Leminorella grimontii]|uniref:hypothetical protein n=1 Tax=Leminorella grimontii TaxID=82981 RepID=UPI00321FC076
MFDIFFSLLVFGIFFLLYKINNLLYPNNKYELVVFFYILLCSYHDYIFINLKDLGLIDNYSIVSSWREIFIILCIAILCLKVFVKFSFNKISIYLFLFIMLSIFLFAWGVSNSYFILDIVIGYRSYLIIPLSFLLFITMKVNINTERFIRLACLLILVPNVVMSVYQYYAIHNITDIWFIDFFVKNNTNIQEWDYFRDERFRPVGFFVSTLSLCIMSIFFVVYSAVNSSFFKLKTILILVLGCIPIYLSSTRVFYLAIIYLFLILFLIKTLRNSTLSSSLIFIGGIFAPIVTLIVIYYLDLDPSSMGRIDQWRTVINFSIDHPLGSGLGALGVGLAIRPDSLLIAYIYLFGFISVVLYLLILLFLAFRYIFVDKKLTIVALILCYIVCFQSVENSFYIQMTIVLFANNYAGYRFYRKSCLYNRGFQWN